MTRDTKELFAGLIIVVVLSVVVTGLSLLGSKEVTKTTATHVATVEVVENRILRMDYARYRLPDGRVIEKNKQLFNSFVGDTVNITEYFCDGSLDAVKVELKTN